MNIIHVFLLYTQEDVIEDDSIETVLDEDEGETPIAEATSTKLPTKQGKRSTKRQRIGSAENELISKAISCMDRAVGGSTNDSFELFGRYVASEVRAITSPQTQRWVKLQIQNILFSAQSAVSTPSQPFHPLPQSPDVHNPYFYPPPFQGPFDQPSSSLSTWMPTLSPTPSLSETSPF